MTVDNKRCTGCQMCVLACSAWHEGAYRPSVARLVVEVDATRAAVKGRTCLQTACAKCEEACPTRAVERVAVTVETADGRLGGYVLKVNEELCNNCGECYEVCPYGVIREHPERKKAFKCDLCDGDPQCLAFCQNPHVLAVKIRQSKVDKTAPA